MCQSHCDDCCGSLTGAATRRAKLWNHLDLDLCIPADGTYFQCETHSGRIGGRSRRSKLSRCRLEFLMMNDGEGIRAESESLIDQFHPLPFKIKRWGGLVLMKSMMLLSSAKSVGSVFRGGGAPRWCVAPNISVSLPLFTPCSSCVGAPRESTSRDETLCRARARTSCPWTGAHTDTLLVKQSHHQCARQRNIREGSSGEEEGSEEGLWEGRSINLCPILQLR
jgi:hypothetical protein